jgi:hypothetical protein
MTEWIGKMVVEGAAPFRAGQVYGVDGTDLMVVWFRGEHITGDRSFVAQADAILYNDEAVVVLNCRGRDEGERKTYARHAVNPYNNNNTLCGLSLKQGHAWATAKKQTVTCGKCDAILWRRRGQR